LYAARALRITAIVIAVPAIVVACADAPKATPVAPAQPPPAPTLASAESQPVAKESAPVTSATPEGDAGAPVAEEPVDAGPHVPACQAQAAQEFLIRSHYIPKWTATADEKKAAAEAHKEAIRYRTEQYGYVAGFGDPKLNAHAPTSYVEETTFMGLKVKMHKRVIPALACVETAIKEACKDKPYTPKALAGIRYKNTFRGGEVTNHMYGIAIDIDPNLNSCCGCVKPWSDDPRCFKKANTPYDRMAMPECWVHEFEKYGFYWLGNDVLQDTMHFDFLGDPEKIMK
jgi:hypothetical protein